MNIFRKSSTKVKKHSRKTPTGKTVQVKEHPRALGTNKLHAVPSKPSPRLENKLKHAHYQEKWVSGWRQDKPGHPPMHKLPHEIIHKGPTNVPYVPQDGVSPSYTAPKVVTITQRANNPEKQQLKRGEYGDRLRAAVRHAFRKWQTHKRGALKEVFKPKTLHYGYDADKRKTYTTQPPKEPTLPSAAIFANRNKRR